MGSGEIAQAHIRPLQDTDFEAVCAIVNYYIETSALNFRTEPQQPDDWRSEWTATRDRHPWLVAVVDGEVVGVAYAGPWKSRAAYDRCAEVTVYVSHASQRGGIGTALYRDLLVLLDRTGFHTTVAVIALPNSASVRLHESLGFASVGVLREVGYKHDAWRDVGLWQRLDSF